MTFRRLILLVVILWSHPAFAQSGPDGVVAAAAA